MCVWNLFLLLSGQLLDTTWNGTWPTPFWESRSNCRVHADLGPRNGQLDSCIEIPFEKIGREDPTVHFQFFLPDRHDKRKKKRIWITKISHLLLPPPSIALVRFTQSPLTPVNAWAVLDEKLGIYALSRIYFGRWMDVLILSPEWRRAFLLRNVFREKMKISDAPVWRLSDKSINIFWLKGNGCYFNSIIMGSRGGKSPLPHLIILLSEQPPV